MIGRRDAMLRLGQLGIGGLTLPGLLGASASPGVAAEAVKGRTRARSCILLFLWGGPPQQDLWDLKPDAPQGIRSLFQPIHTKVPGITICDQMPLLAQHTDKLAVVRSVTHASNEHERSVYHMLTGKIDPSMSFPRNQRRRTDYPSVGSIVSYFSPPGRVPASVTIPRPIGHDGVTYAGTYAGFLGPKHDPMELREAPMSSEQPMHALSLGNGLTTARVQARRGLLHLLESGERILQSAAATDGLSSFHQRAFDMLSSPQAKRAFELDREPPHMRDRYGRNEYGESFLLARRLVEAGVRLVSVIWMYFIPSGRIANVWDNHGGGAVSDFGTASGTEMLKQKYCIPPLDRAYSALLDDLAQRGLLDETLVVAMGEFGRTPKLNAQQGRDHWGPCQSVLLSGGGIRGGQVYGASDRHAAYPKSNPVSPEDLLATIYFALGLPHDGEVHDREHRPQKVSTGTPVTTLFG